MSVDPALTPTEIAALAGPSAPRWGMVHDTTSGNTVATARVNMASITYPLATITVDNTSVDWGDITPGMTILIGSTTGGFDRGIYRVRTFGTSSTLEMMAVGANDSGEINLALRRTGISDNDYITVLRRFDIFGANPRIDYAGVGLDATIYEDWDRLPNNSNRYPAPIVNLTIAGQPANFATHVYDGITATFDIDLDITLWPTSSSVNWVIYLPDSWTVNSGSTSGTALTNTINVTAPHSADAYSILVDVIEDHSVSFLAYRKVWVKSNTYPPLTITHFDSDADDRTGTRCTITLNSLVNMPPGAMVHLFDMGNWNGSDVPTARKCITGYVVRRRESTGTGVASVTLDIVGPSYVMEQIGGQSQILSAVNTTPQTWQQLYYTLSYLDFIIWWLMWQRGRGLLQMFNYTPFGLSNTSHRMTDWRIDAGSLLEQVQSQAVRYGGGNFGCDATGEFILRRNLSRIPWSDRSAIPTRCTIDASIYHDIELDYDERPHLRRLRGECFVSDGLTTNTPFWCDAPPVPGQGTSEEKLERLICDDEDELLSITGDEYQARNNPYPSGSLTIQKNYAVVKPAQMLPIQTDIPAWLRYDGVAYSALQLPTQVTYVHNTDGTVDTQIAFETETVGVPATDVPIPVPDPSLYNSFYNSIPFAAIPPWRSPNPNPAGTPAGAPVVPRDGSVNFTGTETRAWVVRNFLGTPQYKDVTPSDLGSYEIKHGIIVVGSKQAYLLGSDGTNSALWHTPNVFATTVVWTKGDDVSGVFDTVRPANTTGGVLIYSSEPSGTDTTIHFQATNGGLANELYSDYGQTSSPNQAGTWASGDGWEQTLAHNTSAGSINLESVFVGLTFGAPKTLTRIIWTFDRAVGTDIGSVVVEIAGWLSGSIVILQVSADPGPVGSNVTYTWTGSQSVDKIVFATNAGSANFPTDPGGTCTLKSVTYTEGGDNSTVAYSSDFGATFASPIDLGSSAGSIGGFDVQHNGTVSYAASSNEIQKATTLGGSYSNSQAITGANAAMIEIPWYTRNSLSALNSGSSPEYIYGLDQPDGSGHTLYWVVSGTPVNITPTIGGVPGVVTNANCLTTWKGKYIAAVLSFGGVLHLVTSINGGSTWVDRGAVNAPYTRVRRQSATPGQLYMAGAALKYTASFGKSIVSKTKPSSDDLVFWESYG